MPASDRSMGRTSGASFSKPVEQRADHGTVIVSGSELKDQPLVRRKGFGEGQRRPGPRGTGAAGQLRVSRVGRLEPLPAAAPRAAHPLGRAPRGTVAHRHPARPAGRRRRPRPRGARPSGPRRLGPPALVARRPGRAGPRRGNRAGLAHRARRACHMRTARLCEVLAALTTRAGSARRPRATSWPADVGVSRFPSWCALPHAGNGNGKRAHERRRSRGRRSNSSAHHRRRRACGRCRHRSAMSKPRWAALPAHRAVTRRHR